MDNWRESELYVMDEGGNKGFKEYLKKHNASKVDYTSEVAQGYKTILEQKVAEAYRESEKVDENKADEKKQEPRVDTKPKDEVKFGTSEKYDYENKTFQSKTLEVKKPDESKEIAKPKPKKKLGLGGKKINQDIDFNSLVVDDLQLQDKPTSNPEETQKFALRKLDMSKKDEPTQDKHPNPKVHEPSTAKPDINKYKNYTGIGSDMLEAEQNKNVNIKNYSIKNGFGSDQINNDDTAEDTNTDNNDTPFIYFAKRVTSKVKNTTGTIITTIKDKMAK